MSTRELDELAAQTAAYSTLLHPDYAILGGRIAVTRLHKETPGTFSEAMEILGAEGILSGEFMEAMRAHRDVLDATIQTERDLDFDYFGYKTLERSYLLKTSRGVIVERPQYMFMRVALGVHGSLMWRRSSLTTPSACLHDALEAYNLMSSRFYTHATPTLFNAGCKYVSRARAFAYAVLILISVGGLAQGAPKCPPVFFFKCVRTPLRGFMIR